MASDIYGSAFKGGTITCVARVVGADAVSLVQADLQSIDYSVYLLDQQDPDARTPVAGHDEVELAVADTVYDALQTDARWTADTTGYNFAHQIDVSQHTAFAVAGRDYLVEFRLWPFFGQIILVRFRIHCI